MSVPGSLSRCLIRRFRLWRVPFAFLIFCSSGCDLPGRPKAADRSLSAKNERSFEMLFRRNCAGCHGALGKLGPAPPLNDKLFLALVPDDELKRIVAEGRPGTLMPAFATDKGGPLTAEQVLLLAQGLKSHWGPIEPAPAQTPPYRTEPTKPDRAGGNEAGLKVFARACASCHGESGQGGTYAGEPDGNPVGAVNVPEFLALASDQALRRLIITGRPDLGMPNSSDGQGRPEGFKPLTSREVTELVTLLASWREGTNATGKGN
jgi:cytochrome c oxidase cbb3-type subunit III